MGLQREKGVLFKTISSLQNLLYGRFEIVKEALGRNASEKFKGVNETVQECFLFLVKVGSYKAGSTRRKLNTEEIDSRPLSLKENIGFPPVKLKLLP